MSRFSAPFVMKVSFYEPTEENAKKNTAHVRYIGTRPGADRGDPDIGDDDPGSVERDPLEEIDPGTAAGHVKYAGERPGSHGLFDQSGEMPVMKELQQELLEHRGNVWRFVLSLKEEDAIKLGYTEREAWENALRAKTAEAANHMGIKESNLRWVAAFHQEAGHPHVHLMMWEKEPKRSKGRLSKGEMIDVKKTFMREIYAGERSRLLQEKTAKRDLLRELAKGDMQRYVSFIKEVKAKQKDVDVELKAAGYSSAGIAPKLYPEDQKMIISQLNQLAEQMPDRGRMAFKLMPAEVKELSLQIADDMLHHISFQETVNRYMQSVEEMTALYTNHPEAVKKAKQKAYEDIQKRIANVVIRAAGEVNRKDFLEVDEKRAKQVVDAFRQAMGRPEQDMDQEAIRGAAEVLRASGYSTEEARSVFKQWETKADLRKPQENITGLVNQVYQSEDYQIIDPARDHSQTLVNILKFAGFEKEKIIERLQKSPSFDRMNPDALFQQAIQEEKKSDTTFISKNEWDVLKQVGFDIDYPYKTVVYDAIDEHSKSEIVELFSRTRFDPLVPSEDLKREAGWTAFVMNVALKKCGIDAAERKGIVESWAERSDVSVNFDEMNKKIEEDANFLRKPTWERLKRNLGLKDTPYPWQETSETVFDPGKAKEAIEKLDYRPDRWDDATREAVQHVVVKLHKNLSESQKHFQENIESWNQALQEERRIPKEKLQSLCDEVSKRSGDLDVIRRNLGIRDRVQMTVRNFATVLVASGLKPDEVKTMISDWNNRTGLGLSEEKIEKTIDQAMKYHEENRFWGRTTALSKKQFTELCQTLRVEAPYMWKGEYTSSITRSLWKTIFKTIEQEQAKSEAEGEIRRQKMEREAKRRRVKEQEQEL